MKIRVKRERDCGRQGCTEDPRLGVGSMVVYICILLILDPFSKNNKTVLSSEKLRTLGELERANT
jgi:hypothetical protein